MSLNSDLLVPLLPLAALTALLIGLCLVDVIRRPHVSHLPKAVWALVIVMMIPLGAVLYLVLGRARSMALSDRDLR